MTKNHAAKKNPPEGDTKFWDEKSKRLLGFLAKARSWKETRAWGRARNLGTELHIDNQVAYLQNTRRIRMIDSGPVIMWVATVACLACERRGWIVADRKKAPCSCPNARTISTAA